jgi:hypothetical protein
LHWLWYRMTHCQVKDTGRGTVWHIAMWKALVMVPYDTLLSENHNQCISAGNVLRGTTTSVFHLAKRHTVPQPVYFSWQCVLRYHNQCISPGSVLWGTTTSVTGRGTAKHIASWNTLVVVPSDTLPAKMHWSWYRITHCQLKYTGCGTYDTLPSEIHCSVFHLTMCYSVPQPVYFTCQCVIRYHNQCNLAICNTVPQPVQPSNMLYGTTISVFHLAMCQPAEIHWLW